MDCAMDKSTRDSMINTQELLPQNMGHKPKFFSFAISVAHLLLVLMENDKLTIAVSFPLAPCTDILTEMKS